MACSEIVVASGTEKLSCSPHFHSHHLHYVCTCMSLHMPPVGCDCAATMPGMLDAGHMMNAYCLQTWVHERSIHLTAVWYMGRCLSQGAWQSPIAIYISKHFGFHRLSYDGTEPFSRQHMVQAMYARHVALYEPQPRYPYGGYNLSQNERSCLGSWTQSCLLPVSCSGGLLWWLYLRFWL